jgi:hypothetical protein
MCLERFAFSVNFRGFSYVKVTLIWVLEVLLLILWLLVNRAFERGNMVMSKKEI